MNEKIEEIHRMLRYIIISKEEQYRNLVNHGIGEYESRLPDISDILDKYKKNNIGGGLK